MNFTNFIAKGSTLKTTPISSTFVMLLSGGYLLLPFSTGPGSTLGVQAYGLPLIAAASLLALPTVLSAQMWQLRMPVTSLVGILIASVMWMSMTCVISPYPIVSLSRAAINLLGLIVLLGFIAFHIHDPARVNWRTAAFLALGSSAILSIYYIANLAYVVSEHGMDAVILERFVGGLMSLPWGASNNIVSVLLMGIGSAFLLRAHLPRYVLPVLIHLHIIAILLTFSRNGIAMALLLLLLGMTKRERKILLCGVALLVTGPVVTQLVGIENEVLIQLIDDRTTGRGDISNGRLFIWTQIIDKIISNPLEFTGYYSAIFVNETSAHNFALNTLLEQGMPGLILALLLVAKLFTVNAEADRPSGSSVMTFQRLWLVMMINMSVEDPNFTQPFICMFWILLSSQVLRYLDPKNT